MVNSRTKGKVFENWFALRLRPLFPGIHRNWQAQAAQGGADFSESDPFDFEVKAGKGYKSVMVRGWLDQVKMEGKKGNYKAVLVKPDREEPYVIMPFNDFIDLLDHMKMNGGI